MMIFVILLALGGIALLALSPQVRSAFASVTESGVGAIHKAEQLLKPKRVLTTVEVDAIIQARAPNVAQKFKNKWLDAARIAAQSRHLPQTEGILSCSKAGGISGSQLVSAGGGTVISALSLSTATAATIASAGLIAPIGIFASILGAHEQAVKNEQNVLCTAVPSFNQTIDQIKALEISGQLSRQDNINTLNDLLSSFENAIAPVVKDSGSICNAGCGFRRMAEVIIEIEIKELQG